ncbi:MAG: aldehyde ferredoxin oxidoreductase [Desulfobulbaceae bacterium DB1]|nr:MAG: aldehyde ferredoxin oxidoreductase [Desulfobulbaceae bacterium DB1]
MIRNHFRVMVVDLSENRGKVVIVEGRDSEIGGSGLAASLFGKFGKADRPWNDVEQPIIFAIGPLTGYFPLMSKTVCAFKSPYHNQYTESHAGGRTAYAMRFADLDALVIIGRAAAPSCISVGSRHLEIKKVDFMWGMDVAESGKLLRRMFTGSGHRSIMRIGPAGENGAAMACINADTYRHFGRHGGGAAMGAKNLKAIVIQGDAIFPAPEGKKYPALFQEVHTQLTSTDMMKKYHNLGTPANLKPLNKIESLPWRNLQATSDPAINGITGEAFADNALLRNSACAGCPVGCIHIGFVREKFMEDNRYLYRQVAYDYEPIFSCGSMLGVTDTFSVLSIMDEMEKTGLDVMSGGVALAWATEASEKGLISEKETILPLRFGAAEQYKKAAGFLGRGANDFYRLLAQGTGRAAEHYGGGDFACVLGQEMAGYATGEVFFAAQSLSFRHSHLDTAGYTYDQQHEDRDVEDAVNFLMEDELGRIGLNCMVACLFARGVYTNELVARCLDSVGYAGLAAGLDQATRHVRQLRWRTRFSTGYDIDSVIIPKRFFKITTWKGPIDGAYLDALKKSYAERIVALAAMENQ